MRKLLALILFLALCAEAASAQEMLTQQSTPLLIDKQKTLTGARQDNLALAVRGQAINGVLMLPYGTLVKVVARSQFDKKETLHIAGDPMPKDVKRLFQAALVEVMDGAKRGEQGWVVISYQDPGVKPFIYLGAVPANYQAQQASQAQSAADLETSIDLVISIYQGHISPTGGRLYDISITNKGGIPAKGNFEVVVELDGKVIKTESVRGPLAPNQAKPFTIQIGDSDHRRQATLKATVDPKNIYKEANENNNTASQKLQP